MQIRDCWMDLETAERGHEEMLKARVKHPLSNGENVTLLRGV